jgi:hypothetical protein
VKSPCHAHQPFYPSIVDKNLRGFLLLIADQTDIATPHSHWAKRWAESPIRAHTWRPILPSVAHETTPRPSVGCDAANPHYATAKRFARTLADDGSEPRVHWTPWQQALQQLNSLLDQRLHSIDLERLMVKAIDSMFHAPMVLHCFKARVQVSPLIFHSGKDKVAQCNFCFLSKFCV